MRPAMFLIRCEFSGLPRSTVALLLCVVVRRVLLETLVACLFYCLFYCMYYIHRTSYSLCVCVYFFLHQVFGRGLIDGA